MIRDAERRVVEMTDRHAGRLRSELAGRITEAVRDYRRELAAAVEEVIETIRAAIERAADDRRRGENHAGLRLEELAGIERRCTQLATDLERWLQAAPTSAAGGSS